MKNLHTHYIIVTVSCQFRITKSLWVHLFLFYSNLQCSWRLMWSSSTHCQMPWALQKTIFKRLTVLASEIPVWIQEEYFQPLLPSVVKLCQTFPRLCSEATQFLVHLSIVCVPLTSLSGIDKNFVGVDQNGRQKVLSDGKPKELLRSIQTAFQELVDSAVVRL